MATEACKKCGKTLTKLQIRRRRPYCSRECSADARWGDKIRFGDLETRRPLVIAAAKLCQAGYTQAQAAKQLGVHPRMVSDWFEQYGADKFLPERICEHCGKSLMGMPNQSARKYCSRICAWRERYAQKHPNRKRMKFDPALRSEALELYWGGLGQQAIAQHFGISDGTVCCWASRFGGQRRRVKTRAAMRLIPAKQRMREAETADEWLEALRKLTAENSLNSDISPVRLFCKVVNGHSDLNQLVTIITECLKANPFSGETFAFCNKHHDAIITVTWKKTMFYIGRFPRAYGSYIWPREDFGLSVEVCGHEFEHLISCCKTRLKARERFLKNVENSLNIPEKP